jgi:hypothetical protein
VRDDRLHALRHTKGKVTFAGQRVGFGQVHTDEDGLGPSDAACEG